MIDINHRELRKMLIRRSQELLFVILAYGAIALIVLAVADFARSQPPPVPERSGPPAGPDNDGPPPVPETVQLPACACMAGDVCKCDVCVCPPPIDHTGIDAATRIAVKRKIPVVIFVRSAEQFIVGSVTVRVDSMYGHPGPCVVFGVPSPDGHRYFKMTDEHSSAEDIQSQIAQRESEVKGPVAIPFSDPFSSSNQRGPVRPDDSRTNVGLRFHASHNCPQCGRTQTVISGRGPGNTHTHTCARCATTWYH